MPPKVDFYLLKTDQVTARYPLACRLIDKAYQHQHQVYVHSETEQEAHHLDDLLWTFRDDSFIPHNLCGEGPTPPPPIQIGFAATPAHSKDILINLAFEVPDFFSQFKRIIEIIPAEKNWKSKAREHYRFYRAQGCELGSVEI